jgi:hypothetical protein
MSQYETNSAEASLHLRGAMNKLDHSLTNGASAESANLAVNVSTLATALLGVIVREHTEMIEREKMLRKERAKA